MTSVAAIDLIRPALRRIGAIGAVEQPTANQIAAGLDALNGIVDWLSVEPQGATCRVESVYTLAAGQTTITIGPGGQVNIPRPMRVESAYARFQNLDENIQVCSKEVYDAIGLKTVGSTWPEYLWYDQALPIGTAKLWPVPQASIDIHLTTLATLAPFANANSAQELPGGYRNWLDLELSIACADTFNLPVSPITMQRRNAAWDAMVKQNLVVPELWPQPQIRTRLGQFLGGGQF